MPLSRFDPEVWNRVTPRERIAQCHHMAGQLRALAKHTHGDANLVYSELARAWGQLAQELERSYYAELS